MKHSQFQDLKPGIVLWLPGEKPYYIDGRLVQVAAAPVDHTEFKIWTRTVVMGSDGGWYLNKWEAHDPVYILQEGIVAIIPPITRTIEAPELVFKRRLEPEPPVPIQEPPPRQRTFWQRFWDFLWEER